MKTQRQALSPVKPTFRGHRMTGPHRGHPMRCSFHGRASASWCPVLTRPHVVPSDPSCPSSQ